MATKTNNFRELREHARAKDPNWDANVAEYKAAMLDALAFAEPRQSRNVTQVKLAEQLGITQGQRLACGGA